jgi:hypothetical protein
MVFCLFSFLFILLFFFFVFLFKPVAVVAAAAVSVRQQVGNRGLGHREGQHSRKEPHNFVNERKKKQKKKRKKITLLLAGLEPATSCSVGRRSIQLI